MRQEHSVAAVIAAAGSVGGRHSTLYLWMKTHRIEFAAQLEERGANWIGLTKTFERIGLVAANGRPASVKVVRQTWHRVLRATAAK